LCFFVGASASTGSSTFPVVADDGSLLKTTTFTLNVTGTFLARPRWGREIKRRVAMPEPAIVAPSPENASAADAAEVANDLSTYTTPVVRKRRVGALPARQVVALAAATRPAASIAEAEAPAAPEPEPEPELPPERPPAREPESETSLDAPS
jgi:hypothetical protein